MGNAETGARFYYQLPTFAEQRRNELESRLRPVLNIADSYGCLVSRAVCALGKTPPASRHDSIIRDLIADVFDFLYEWPRLLLEGRVQVAFPLARRAYESLSLLSGFYQDSDLAQRWDRGQQIANAKVRQALAKLPFPEPEEATKKLYKFFSAGTHPNRDFVAERFLGDGNEYVLGSVGEPNLLLIVDHCHRLIQMWFWFGALVSYVAREPLRKYDPGYGDAYLEVTERAKRVTEWLVEQFNDLLDELQRQEGD